MTEARRRGIRRSLVMEFKRGKGAGVLYKIIDRFAAGQKLRHQLCGGRNVHRRKHHIIGSAV